MLSQLSTVYYSVNGNFPWAVFIAVYIVVYIVIALGMYGTFKKAGQPGWAAFIPFYNWWVMLKVAGRPESWFWFIFLGVIPFIGWIGVLVVGIIVLNDISKSFGHEAAFTVGLVLLSPIFWYILWLGPSTYRGPAAAVPAGYPPGGYAPQPGQGYPPQGGYAPQPGQAYPPQQAPQAYPPQPGQAYPPQQAPQAYPPQQPPPQAPPPAQPPPAAPQ